MTPTLHLTNFSSRKLHGPGRVWTIMAHPRHWEHGDGWALALVPDIDEVPLMLAALADRGNPATMAAYRQAIEARWAQSLFLAPWKPVALTTRETDYAPDGEWVNVRDGDTLCCACSRAEAAAGRCRRSWSAPFLHRAGWRVLLDGAVVTP